jgi:hypothetical protein
MKVTMTIMVRLSDVNELIAVGRLPDDLFLFPTVCLSGYARVAS